MSDRELYNKLQEKLAPYNTWQVERMFDISLHNAGRKKDNEVFCLSVGAMDGHFHDTMAGYISLYRWGGLFIEPLPDAFKALSNYYTEVLKNDKVILENVAVSNEMKVETMCYIPWDKIDNLELDYPLKGMASFIPPVNGFDSDPKSKALLDEHGEMCEVPVVVLNSLLEKHNIERIDYVTVDTEGHDYWVFEGFDLEKYRPKVIKFELFNSEDGNLDKLFTRLITSGYTLCNQEGCDIMAFENEHLEFIKNNRRWPEVEKLGLCIENTGYRLDKDGNYVDVPENVESGDDDYKEPEPEAYQIDNVPEKPAQVYSNEGPSKTTIVTGIWDLKRDTLAESFNRPFSHYTDKLIELLKTDTPMIVYIDPEYEELVWEHRSPENTQVIVKPAEEFKTWFEFFDQVQKIRSNPEWYNKASWLPESTQAGLELYNPMVMSKMFMLNDARISNPFDTDYFLWVDGAITNTIHQGYFTHDKVINKIHHYLQKFLFICFPYENHEIHGFDHDRLREYCNVDKTTFVARAGIFGGHKDYISDVNSLYYDYLKATLDEEQMGTEESIFTILSYKHDDIIDRVMIRDDGLIECFFENLKNDTVDLITTKKIRSIDELKTYLYVITYNSPSQFEKLCENWAEREKFLYNTKKVVLNNSTDESTQAEYDRVCETWDFTQIKKDNIGICGGRQWVAEHFEQTDGDYYIFLEDDMYIHTDWKGTCPNGFATYIKDLYDKTHTIMEREGYDFLKFCFTEFFGDNRVQWAWYNVPQELRERHWPEKKFLPANGLDPNAPLTNFKSIKNEKGLAYADGEIFYCNWPQIVSREGNKKMFLDETWAAPFEQTWMSYIFQETVKGNINPAILLATPCFHERFDYYEASERREN